MCCVGGQLQSRLGYLVREDYYEAIEGRPLRPLFVEAVAFLPSPDASDRARVTIYDLGCGDGSESVALLAQDWTVVAIDSVPEAIARLRASLAPEHAARLTTLVGRFHEVDLPDADFVYAGLSLSLLHSGRIRGGLASHHAGAASRGVFAGHFFGPHDSWASTQDMTFQTREALHELFAAFEVHLLKEQDEDGPAVSGPKHWHVFHVIATKLPD